ncbi:hypothetical protein [uncultured Amphritea sp.]|nr:hypothetical protein [uncultured Amphritea sp.]
MPAPSIADIRLAFTNVSQVSDYLQLLKLRYYHYTLVDARQIWLRGLSC